MAKLDLFAPPRPWPAFSRAMSWVNRFLMLHGIPLLRDVPFLNSVPGIRGLTGIRTIVAEQHGFARLKNLVSSGDPVFILPNHPEFFTDWMLDKDIIARAAPEAASWATNGVVNGMGNAMQTFWLWNNLIAQIPGDSAGPKAYSVDWASRGKGVLLHPEGMVGWHPDWIGPLMPGAADMAKECATKTARPAWLQPVVWKIIFNGDVSRQLAREMAYVERRLKLKPRPELDPAGRAHQAYIALVDRDLSAHGLHVVDSMSLKEKLETLQMVLAMELSKWLKEEALPIDHVALISRVRKKIRTDGVRTDVTSKVTRIADTLQKHRRLGAFAFEKSRISQEETAAHIKRLRNDWCKGTLRDTTNAFLPQPAGLRTAHLRFPEPVEVLAGADAAITMASVRQAMQTTLNAINSEFEVQTSRFSQINPFYSA